MIKYDIKYGTTNDIKYFQHVNSNVIKYVILLVITYVNKYVIRFFIKYVLKYVIKCVSIYVSKHDIKSVLKLTRLFFEMDFSISSILLNMFYRRATSKDGRSLPHTFTSGGRRRPRSLNRQPRSFFRRRRRRRRRHSWSG